MYKYGKVRSGFTLVEILVVIAIIGILSSIVLASMSGARSKGRDTKRISDVKQLQLALQLYYDGNNSVYPPKATDGTVSAALAPLVTTGYLSTLPTDPSGGTAAYGYSGLPANCTTACGDYVLGAKMENDPSLFGGFAQSQAITINGTAYNCNQITSPDYIFCVKPI